MKSRPATTPQTPLSMVKPAGERPTFPLVTLVHQHLTDFCEWVNQKRENRTLSPEDPVVTGATTSVFGGRARSPFLRLVAPPALALSMC